MPEIKGTPYLRSRTIQYRNRGPRRSVKVEPGVWDAFDEIRKREGLTRGQMLAKIAERHNDIPIGNAVREYVLEFYRERARQLDFSKATRRDLWAALYAIYGFVEENGPAGVLPNMETLGPEPAEMASKIIDALGRAFTR